MMFFSLNVRIALLFSYYNFKLYTIYNNTKFKKIQVFSVIKIDIFAEYGIIYKDYLARCPFLKTKEIKL